MPDPEPTPPARTPPCPRRSRWPGRRVWAAALITFRQGIRARLWLMVPLAIAVLVVTDLSSRRFDPVFEGIPAAVSTTMLVLAVLAVLIGLIFATYSFPAEVDSRVISTVVTKPIGRGELVAGKVVGMSLLALVLMALVAGGGYVYTLARASHVRSLASERLAEAEERAVYDADLNALRAVAQNGPMQAYRYRDADVGPRIAIRHAPGFQADPDARWVLGETGMRLQWDLTDTPLRPWSAAGPCVLHLDVDVRRPADAETPTHLGLELLGDGGGAPDRPLEEGAAAIRYRQSVEVGASGRIIVPLAPISREAPEGGLNVPPEGRIELTVMAKERGHLVGVRPGSLRIVAPGGRSFAVTDAPETAPALKHSRQWLAGSDQLPRQVASFHFDDVPARVLGHGPVAVELAFSLDAWSPATVETTAEATFLNPGTGEQRVSTFSPESYHATLLYLDPAFWRGGPLELRVECLTDEDFLGVLPGTARIRLAGGPFAWNLAKGVLKVWLFGTTLAAAGILLSTRLTWFVSILGAIAFLAFGMFRDFLLKHTVLAPASAWLADRLTEWTGRLECDALARHLVLPLPDLRAMLPGTAFNLGQALSLASVGETALWAGGTALVVVAVGAWLLRTREVAS